MTIYYVGQNSAGSGNGAGYENRMSVSQHNSRTFNPGDVIYLVDAIKSRVVRGCQGRHAGRQDVLYQMHHTIT